VRLKQENLEFETSLGNMRSHRKEEKRKKARMGKRSQASQLLGEV
jgi:hypothetical protein